MRPLLPTLSVPARCWLAFAVVTLGSARVQAHPVGVQTYDRALRLGLTAEALYVDYELEINTFTVEKDLGAVADEEYFRSKPSQPSDYYNAFLRLYAPILAGNLTAQLDGKALVFECVKKSYEVRDQSSLHCAFRFRAPWRPVSGTAHELTFYEENYKSEAGTVKMGVVCSEAIATEAVDVPSDALQSKAPTQLKPDEEEKLRRAMVTFTTSGVEPEKPPEEERPAPPAPTPSVWEARSLEDLVMHSGEALWLLLILALFFGGAHALTPGHGKTLVAAYLIGERGTVWHALYLGVMTTVSHTGVVLLIAGLVQVFFCGDPPAWVQTAINLFAGFGIAGIGAWLLLTRLTGRADHVHLGGQGHGHGHGHGHGDGEPYHEGHGHGEPSFGWWRMTVLGFLGGIVPCYDAIVLYLLMARLHMLAYALPILLAFSAGLAVVLVAIGIAVVQAKGAASQRWGETRAFKALPIVSAAIVMVLGLGLCFLSVYRSS